MANDRQDDLGEEGFLGGPEERAAARFDPRVLWGPLTDLPTGDALVFSAEATVTDAIRAMQREHCGCVIVTDDGTSGGELTGIFTERDVLLRIVDRGRNPAALPLGEVMTPDPEVLSDHSTIAYALSRMSVGGFRHLPVVDDDRHPVFVISLRDIVEFLVAEFPREALTLPGDPGRPPQRTREGA